jgi:acetate kinase
MRSILTINAGSSSLKFALFGLNGMLAMPLMRGAIEGLGGHARLRVQDGAGARFREQPLPATPTDSDNALDVLLSVLSARFPRLDLVAVGHRVVHGGGTFSAPVLLTGELMGALEDLVPLAPLHQPFNLKGVTAASEAFPGVPQIACFDTAFHAGHAFEECAFGLPRKYFDDGIRRYGFHGLSYEYVARQMARIAPGVADGRMVVAHLGNGASLCAIRDGKSVASTMGFSVLDGLMMGTRCGQIDPGVLIYLADRRGMDAAAIARLLYHESGLKGLSGVSHDMRVLEASDDPHAADAVACFVARLRREIGAMAATIGGIDALVFTGGIGENSAPIRAAVTAGLGWLGIALDPARDADPSAVEISRLDSPVRVFRVPTDDEAMIARHVVGLMAAAAADLVPLDKVAWVA